MYQSTICLTCNEKISGKTSSDLDEKSLRHLSEKHPEKRKELAQQTRELLESRQRASDKLANFKATLFSKKGA